MRLQRVILGNLLVVMLHVSLSAEPPVGLANRSWSDDELFTVVSHMPRVLKWEPGWEENGWGDNPTYSLLINGYVGVACKDALSFVDISDPLSPEVVATHWFGDRHRSIENDGWGVTTGYGGIHAIVIDSSHLDIWDYADHTNPTHVGTVELPRPYQPGNMDPWRYGVGYPVSAAWQAPYLYSAMRNVGIDVIDVHDPADPRQIKRIDPGFGSGNVYVVGNLLFEANYNGPGIAIYDISDPENPVLLDSEVKDEKAKGWQIWVNGNKLYRSGEAVHVWDVSNPSEMNYVKSFHRSETCIQQGEGSHGHCASGGTDTQDGYLFFGGSHFGVFKWNIETGEEVGYSGPFLKPGGEGRTDYYDLDYPSVFGNMVVGASEDHYQGVFFIPHQKDPDTTPPEVNMVVPADNATSRALTSRVGVTFTDAVDVTSVTNETFIVRKAGGSALEGKYSFSKSIVNFSPDEPLESGATYEVVIPAGGVTDYVGNATAADFVSRFSTGDAVAVKPVGKARTRAARAQASSIRMKPLLDEKATDAANGRLFSIRGECVAATPDRSGTAMRRSITPGIYVISPTE